MSAVRKKSRQSKDSGSNPKGSRKAGSTSKATTVAGKGNIAKSERQHAGGKKSDARSNVRNSSNGAKKRKIKRSVKAVMAEFKNARMSDVCDKVFVAESPVHGKGLFAAKRIKANTVLGRLHGMPTYDDGIYVLWITDEIGLELTNDFRFINHSKSANAAYSDLDVTLLKDVEAGDELLHDYGWDH